MEDPNTLAATAQEPATRYSAIEFTAWSEFVKLCVSRGEHMQEAIRQADAYIEARRKRHPQS